MGQQVYTQRDAESSPLYRIVKDHYANFQLTYNNKYGQKYGFYRSEIDLEIEKFLKCGIYKYGVARIRCPKPGCEEERYRPFSCKSRSFCGSCVTRHALELEIRLEQALSREWIFQHHSYRVFQISHLALQKYLLYLKQGMNCNESSLASDELRIL